jgi:hypothetical protein
MAGEIASLLLSRMSVPIVYYIVNKRKTTGQIRAHIPEAANVAGL